MAVTINKAQGQTYKRVGLWLPTPVFSHGQLYVALSRVGDGEQLWISAAPFILCSKIFDKSMPWTLDEDPLLDGLINIVWQDVL
jgi:hypothetical protein